MTWTVADVMTCGAVSVEPSTSFKACADLMRIHGVSALPVVAGGRLAGIVSESDLLRKQAGPSVRDPSKHTATTKKEDALAAGELMTAKVVTTTCAASLTAAARLMFQHRVKRLPVVDSENRLVGIVSRSDVLRVFLRSDESIRREVARELLTSTALDGRGRIEAEVKDGVVILHGTVETGRLVALLTRVVGGVPGVVGVKTELKVRDRLTGPDLLGGRNSDGCPP